MSKVTNTIHGMSKSNTYKSWSAMKMRCDNEKSSAYRWYGRRGITYDQRWSSFENFLEDMGERPEGTSLDRINVNDNYTKDNCRWATAQEQARNRTVSCVITFNDESKTVVDWAEQLGIKYGTLLSRLQRYNWDVEKAFLQAVAKRNKDSSNELIRGDTYTYEGETKTITEWSKYLDIPMGTLYTRLRENKSLDQVFRKKDFKYKYLQYNGETKLLSEWAKELGMYPQKIRERLKIGWSVEKALSTP